MKISIGIIVAAFAVLLMNLFIAAEAKQPPVAADRITMAFDAAGGRLSGPVAAKGEEAAVPKPVPQAASRKVRVIMASPYGN